LLDAFSQTLTFFFNKSQLLLVVGLIMLTATLMVVNVM
jgi:hypothetical protein